jgi:hypothetical protein
MHNCASGNLEIPDRRFAPSVMTAELRSVRLPAGGGLLGAAGRARSTHIMQFRPVGVESSGEKRAKEGPDSGEGMGVSVAAVCR